MDPATKEFLSEIANDPALGNKTCADCGGMNPQWASLSFAAWICLSCAGIHRGFGVHISFVRSVSMDTWTDEQLRRMKLGGNIPWNDFLKSYSPVEAGGYAPGMSIHDKYHCWAATQYREKLNAELAGESWSPSAPPANNAIESPARPDSSQSLRKSRAGTRSGSMLSRQDSGSTPGDQKAANEAYFDSLGAINATRREDLPPSQGGRYTGFGSTPTPESQHPSFGLSSASAPSLADIQSDPIAALGKGWSLFSSAIVGATRVVNETVIQPGVEKVSDPNFRNDVTSYVSSTTATANSWTKDRLGVDVGQYVRQVGASVGGAIGNVGGTTGRPNPSGGGYQAVGQHNGQYGEWDDDERHGSALYADAGNDDFFAEFNEGAGGSSGASRSNASSGVGSGSTKPPVVPKKDDWQEDDWKDF